MIDLNKAGAWSDVEQLEIAELLRNLALRVNEPNDYENSMDVRTFRHQLWTEFTHKIVDGIDATTGGESDGNGN